MNSDELVSIIIPTFNRINFIGETLDSVLSQNFSNWECIVVDDGSNDYTEELMKFYCENDSRINFYCRPATRKKGASSCRNLGFEKSKGKYIQYLDSDDLLSPHKLSTQLLDIKMSSDKTVYCCGWSLFSDNIDQNLLPINFTFRDEFINPCNFLGNLGKKNIFYPPHCYLVPRKVIQLAGGWNEDLTNNDDGEFFSRVILNSTGIIFTNKTQVFYRKQGSDHLSNYNNSHKISSVIASWKLIETHLTENCNEESLIYVKNAKYWLFQTIKNKYPLLTFKYKDFFIEEFEIEPYRLKNNFIFKKVTRNYLSSIKGQIIKKRD